LRAFAYTEESFTEMGAQMRHMIVEAKAYGLTVDLYEDLPCLLLSLEQKVKRKATRIASIYE